MKKLLLLLVMLLLPMVVNAYTAKIDNIYYNFDTEAKTATVTWRNIGGGSNKDAYTGTLNIPSTVTYNGDEYSVTSIGKDAFNYCYNLLSITIPSSIIYIAGGAFDETGWYNNQPDGIVYLGDWVINYKGEKPSGSLTIIDGTRGIAELAFYSCGNMTNITIPNSVKYIGARAFEGCSSLTSVTIPDGVTSIKGGTFSGCSSLTSIAIPNSVTSIESTCAVAPWTYGAFKRCSSLISVTLGENLETIGSEAFYGCTSLTSVSIPDKVTYIGGYAFANCSNLVTVTIPSSVKSIEGYAFRDCNSLASVHISDIESWCQISFGSGDNNNPLEFAHHLYLGNEEIKDLVIPNSITSIGDNTFIGCSSLTSVTIPETVTNIGSYAFKGCSGLTSVTIPKTVTDIGRCAFQGCSGLSSINIPSNVTIINCGTFYGCSSLTDIIIPNGITKIEDADYYSGSIHNYVGAFDGCRSLTSITFPNSLTSIGNYAFRNCSNLKSINIANSVHSIGESAFENCSKAETLILPNELQIIRKAAFKGCNNVKSVTIPAMVEYIYQEAFAYCYGLEHVNVLSRTPAFLYDNSFSDFSIPLKVPKGCKEAYQSAQGWKNFSNISDADKYKLTYKVDNKVYKSYEIEEGATITPEEAPTKEGYTFSGWSEIPETMPAHDVTVIGTFSINKYKLTYTVDGTEYKSYEVEYGTTITPEAVPTKEGYTFSGWSEIPETMPAHDATVAGTFSINKYKLTYTVDGTEYKTYDVEYGATITAEAEPAKEGHTFSGWSEIPQTMPAHDVTVIGTFSINKYKLTYTVDGEEYKSSEVEYGATITPEAEPIKEGYTFSGWSEIPETMPAKDVNITGTFTINSYKLTYMIDDKVYKETMYEYGATITPEPQPEGDYQTFEWTDLPQTMPAHDVVVYASYTSGIIEVLMASQQNLRIYSPNGKKLNKLQKGLNIVILDDGTVKKVIMK